MRKFKNYVDKINNEVQGAKEYAEKYVEEKAKGETAKANKYREMATDELKHANYIHDFATTDIAELERIYTPPMEMQDKWEHAHAEYVEMVAWIKQMLALQPMITLEELTADIAELESKPTTFQNCERLSVLYALQDRLQKSAEQSHIMSYSCVTELQESVEPLTENNILPSYSAYVDTKRQYQQGEISKEKVLKNLETLSDEIKDFLKRLYRNSDMPEERNILSKTITEINVGIL